VGVYHRTVDLRPRLFLAAFSDAGSAFSDAAHPGVLMDNRNDVEPGVKSGVEPKYSLAFEIIRCIVFALLVTGAAWGAAYYAFGMGWAP
jgi:hypothetical protein